MVISDGSGSRTTVASVIVVRLLQKRITFSRDQKISGLSVNHRDTTPPPHIVPAYAFTDQYFLIGTSMVPSSTVPSDVSPSAKRPAKPKKRSPLAVAPLP